MHTEAPISINLHTPNKTQITLRANNADEFTALSATIFAIVEAVSEIETAVRGSNVNAAVPPNPQVASIATSFGATVVDSFDGPPAFVAPSMGAGSRNCPHGTMTRIHGLTGKFGPYKGYFCPAKQNDPSKCTTQYIKQNQAEWNSFVPDQTKA
jgi:hypothetical protein